MFFIFNDLSVYKLKTDTKPYLQVRSKTKQGHVINIHIHFIQYCKLFSIAKKLDIDIIALVR